MPDLDAHLLPIAIFLPIATALALLASGIGARALGLPRLPATAWRTIGLLASGGTFCAALVLFARFEVARPGFQFVEHALWIPGWGIDFFVGVDGISLVLLLLATFLVPVVFLATWNDIAHSLERFVVLLLCIETALVGALLSLNLVQFYVFSEAALLATFFAIGSWGGAGRVRAALQTVIFGGVGSMALLLAMLALASFAVAQTGAPVFNLLAPPSGGPAALVDVVVPVVGPGGWHVQAWLFVAFAFAFAIRTPLVPLHAWLPDAETEAPAAGATLLSGVLLALGAYGFLRFALPLFPAAAVELAPVLLALGLVGVFYGWLLALAQTDLKRMVACASVAHLGLASVGVFSLAVTGMNGAVLQLVNHGLSTGALFLLVGMLEQRRGTREIAEFGGVARPMPVYAACFAVAALASMGLPGTNGFVSELLILVGTAVRRPWAAVLAACGLVLAAATLLRAYRRVLFGPIDVPENRGLIDLGLREKLVMLALIVPMLGIGVHPEPLLRRIQPAVVTLVERLDAHTEAPVDEPPAEADGVSAS